MFWQKILEKTFRYVLGVNKIPFKNLRASSKPHFISLLAPYPKICLQWQSGSVVAVPRLMVASVLPVWDSNLPAAEINMFGHVSQMRKPKFCELVWIPAVSQPMWVEWKLDFATKKTGQTAAEPWGTVQPARILATLHLGAAKPIFCCV